MYLTQEQVGKFYFRLINLADGYDNTNSTRIHFADSTGQAITLSQNHIDNYGGHYFHLGPDITAMEPDYQMRISQEDAINLKHELQGFMDDY